MPSCKYIFILGVLIFLLITLPCVGSTNIRDILRRRELERLIIFTFPTYTFSIRIPISRRIIFVNMVRLWCKCYELHEIYSYSLTFLVRWKTDKREVLS